MEVLPGFGQLRLMVCALEEVRVVLLPEKNKHKKQWCTKNQCSDYGGFLPCLIPRFRTDRKSWIVSETEVQERLLHGRKDVHHRHDHVLPWPAMAEKNIS